MPIETRFEIPRDRRQVPLQHVFAATRPLFEEKSGRKEIVETCCGLEPITPF